MKEIRSINFCVEVARECEVKYYVWADPNLDAHWRHEPCFVLDDKYFDTKEEAQAFIDENYKKAICAVLSIGERVALLDKSPITVTGEPGDYLYRHILKEEW